METDMKTPTIHVLFSHGEILDGSGHRCEEECDAMTAAAEYDVIMNALAAARSWVRYEDPSDPRTKRVDHAEVLRLTMALRRAALNL